MLKKTDDDAARTADKNKVEARPVGKSTIAAVNSALESLKASDRCGAPDRLKLIFAAHQLVRVALDGFTRSEIHDLIPYLVGLSSSITSVIDQVVMNSSSDDECLTLLRDMASREYLWPMMVRPRDRKLFEDKCEKLGIGSDSIVKGVQQKKKQVSFSTPSNRFTVDLLRRVFVFAGFISGCVDEFEAIELIKRGFRGIEDDKAKKLLSLLKDVIEELHGHPEPLTESTVKLWNRWLPDFVLNVDPELVKFPELRQVRAQMEKGTVAKYSKDLVSKRRSALQKFFSRPLRKLAK